MNVAAYLAKLGLKKEEPSFDFLKKLHRKHLLTIPFENLSIHYGGRIILDIDRIFDKIMPGNRGGYCYELNGLFYKLLMELGFKCSLHEARFFRMGDYSAPFDHMVISVNLGEFIYLADVGMKTPFVFPKKIVKGAVQLDFGNYYRLEQDIDDNWILQQSEDASHFSTLYRITPEPVNLIQFLDRNDQHQDLADSHFVLNKYISKLTEGGRITLSHQKLTILDRGETTETEIMNEDAFLSNLHQYFEIDPTELVQ